jgi:hypothetical protein
MGFTASGSRAPITNMKAYAMFVRQRHSSKLRMRRCLARKVAARPSGLAAIEALLVCWGSQLVMTPLSEIRGGPTSMPTCQTATASAQLRCDPIPNASIASSRATAYRSGSRRNFRASFCSRDGGGGRGLRGRPTGLPVGFVTIVSATVRLRSVLAVR